jgi:hypothetical protein
MMYVSLSQQVTAGYFECVIQRFVCYFLVWKQRYMYTTRLLPRVIGICVWRECIVGAELGEYR